ncbi:hypothetical protein [Amycolatopsis sp. Poz14]|uniref:hypothetical protein n=1 Tax=Amycolatopsis sp. Poz14 TaxID=1447705 RepID=UPI001EE8B80A|nr:hypothetical protein [Amycolatopsis sp. Poz14]MCG3756685.1 hypothetical protein [Amycolatopsis sp. Poz14]
MTAPELPLPDGLDMAEHSANCMNFAGHRRPVLTLPAARLGPPHPDLTLAYRCEACGSEWTGTFPVESEEP